MSSAAIPPETDVEWLGGLLKLPAYITGDGEPYRPYALFFLDENRVVLHSRVAKPGLLLTAAAQSLLHTIGQPLFGHKRRPTAIRVASAELARELQAGCPELKIRCAPTPELEALASALREKFEQRTDQEESYLAAGASPAAMASFFDAAAELYRAAPWQVIASDQHLMSVTIEKLGLKHAVLSVIGQLGKNAGFVLFGSYAAFQAYLSAGVALARGESASMPAHFTLHFERGSELPTSLRKQIISQGWQVADTEAFPWMRVLDEDLVARMPTPAELSIAELIARGLPKLLEQSRPSLHAAWSGSRTLQRKLDVAAFAGLFEVTFVASNKLEPQLRWAVNDVFAQFTSLVEQVSEPKVEKIASVSELHPPEA
jgi:hypothetical protein